MSLCLPTEIPDVGFAVTTRRLQKRYGDEIALHDVGLQVPSGAVYVLIGPNGAGKSTTLKLLLNLLRPDGGAVEVFGLDVGRHGPQVRSGVGYVPEGPPWGHRGMAMGRLLEHHATYFPAWDREYSRRLLKAFALPVDKRLGGLSKGQARLVHLTMAMAHRPPLLILDEPTDGLDPVMRDEALGQLTRHITESPTTLILSTHQVHEVENFADHLGVLRAGRLIAQMHRNTLGRMFRQYTAEVSDGWLGAAQFSGRIFRCGQLGSEIRWSIWGEEQDVVRELERSGAVVRDVRPLSLEESVLALLSREPTS